MNQALTLMSRLVTARPYLTIGVLILITIVLGAGGALRAEIDETDGYFPPDNPVIRALADIDELFSQSGEIVVITLLFRGEALNPEGLSQMSDLIDEIVSDPEVAALLTPADPIVAPSLIIETVLQRDGFESVTQAEIDAVRSVPAVQGALSALTGVDTDGTPVAIATIRLQDTVADRLQDAERRVSNIAVGSEGNLSVSSVSPVVIEDEYQRAYREDTGPLIGIAFVLIAGVIFLFLRSPSDLVLSLAGLIMSIVWVVGAEGWLGPNGLALLGRPSGVSVIIPILIISLTVDYAIQVALHYREARSSHDSVLIASRSGLQIVTIPLALAAFTTIGSFLVGVLSPIPAIKDFGVVAGLGVGMSVIVMLTLLPAGRLIIDRRRESRGRLAPPRQVSQALPGVDRIAEFVGGSVTRQPLPYFVAILALSIGFGIASTQIESRFTILDLLPSGGSVASDWKTLDAATGGSSEIASLLLHSEVTDIRTIVNLGDLTSAFDDELRRPQAGAGPLQASFVLILRDWIDDSGEPGDKYDPELAALYEKATAGVQLDPVLMQEFLDKLEARDPAVAHLLVNDPQGIDSILLQFPALTNDPEFTKVLQEEIEGLWFGEDEDITVVSGSVISATVTEEMTSRQTEAIAATIATALGILFVFFWVTLRQPVFALVAVGPIVLVLIWILGTLALLGIPYTIVTATITALSVGIGVDYTIHIIHRYREEYGHNRNHEMAAVRTLKTTGSALLGSALTTGTGVGVLIVSSVPALQQFGITVVITIAYSLFLSVLLVPSAMTVWGAYQNMRLRSRMITWAHELDEEIEAALNQREEQQEGGAHS
jgi:predicted RND superfamily exporter protein